MKGQISAEMLISVGVVVAFTVPVLLLLISLSQFGFERSATLQADATAKSIAENVNEVYIQGANAKRAIFLNLPTGTKTVKVDNKEVSIRLAIGGGYYEASAPVFVPADRFEINEKSGVYAVSMFNDGSKVILSGS